LHTRVHARACTQTSEFLTTLLRQIERCGTPPPPPLHRVCHVRIGRGRDGHPLLVQGWRRTSLSPASAGRWGGCCARPSADQPTRCNQTAEQLPRSFPRPTSLIEVPPVAASGGYW